jgi:2-oxoglutarate ferredoxin oxidoreductase subunit beta
MNLSTKAKITWCPGCPDFAILVAFRQVVEALCLEEKLKIENIVVGAGIGCHGKIVDYLNMNTFNSLHGRLIPALTGIKIGAPHCKVVGFTGDGDSFSEGLSHLVHGAQKNTDITLFLHNNQTFALTVGQATGTSPKGFKGGSTPFGSVDEPFVPLSMVLASGATFVARTYAIDIEGTKKIMKAAIEHKGFAFVEIIQPCITFFDTREHFKDLVYWIAENEYDTTNFDAATAFLGQENERVPLGIFYSIIKETFEEKI